MGLFEGNRVIDPIPHIADGSPRIDQLLDNIGFLLGECFGKVMVNAKLLRQLFRGRLIISRNDVARLNSWPPPQFADNAFGFWTYRG